MKKTRLTKQLNRIDAMPDLVSEFMMVREQVLDDSRQGRVELLPGETKASAARRILIEKTKMGVIRKKDEKEHAKKIKVNSKTIKQAVLDALKNGSQQSSVLIGKISEKLHCPPDDVGWGLAVLAKDGKITLAHWTCKTHGEFDTYSIGCPDCVREVRKERIPQLHDSKPVTVRQR